MRPECVPPLIEAARSDEAARHRPEVLARSLIAGHAPATSGGAASKRWHARSRSTVPPGLALLSLAEALLRVPDAANGNRLLRDRLSRIDWSAQPGGGALAARAAAGQRPALRGPAGWLSAHGDAGAHRDAAGDPRAE
jgi:proline dehydrogenase